MQQLGPTNDAANSFEKAATLDTNCWQARFTLATSNPQQGRSEEARREFNAVLRLQGGFAPALRALERIDQNGPVAPLRP